MVIGCISDLNGVRSAIAVLEAASERKCRKHTWHGGPMVGSIPVLVGCLQLKVNLVPAVRLPMQKRIRGERWRWSSVRTLKIRTSSPGLGTPVGPGSKNESRSPPGRPHDQGGPGEGVWGARITYRARAPGFERKPLFRSAAVNLVFRTDPYTASSSTNLNCLVDGYASSPG